MYITLNCIAVAIVTGLVTVLMLTAVVLLLNNRTTAAVMHEKPWSCSDDNTPCLVYQNNGRLNHDIQRY